MVQALLARQQFEGDARVTGGVPVPADISTSGALIQAMLFHQRAEDLNEDWYHAPGSQSSSFTPLAQASDALEQAMRARKRAENADELSSSAVMMQVMQARQKAEEEERFQWMPAPPHNPAPSSSSALIQAMLARQQAQNEFDDGY